MDDMSMRAYEKWFLEKSLTLSCGCERRKGDSLFVIKRLGKGWVHSTPKCQGNLLVVPEITLARNSAATGTERRSNEQSLV